VAMSLSAIMVIGLSCELIYVNAGVDELQLAGCEGSKPIT
jgi:hypothetical protein